MAGMAETLQVRVRWFHLTPGRFVIGLLLVEFLLWVSNRFRWLPKGWPVLIAIATLATVMLAMFLWLAGALIFRWRFQFSIRSLLALQLADRRDERGGRAAECRGGNQEDGICVGRVPSHRRSVFRLLFMVLLSSFVYFVYFVVYFPCPPCYT
jgi:hypothetical protein